MRNMPQPEERLSFFQQFVRDAGRGSAAFFLFNLIVAASLVKHKATTHHQPVTEQDLLFGFYIAIQTTMLLYVLPVSLGIDSARRREREPQLYVRIFRARGRTRPDDEVVDELHEEPRQMHHAQ